MGTQRGSQGRTGGSQGHSEGRQGPYIARQAYCVLPTPVGLFLARLATLDVRRSIPLTIAGLATPPAAIRMRLSRFNHNDVYILATQR